MSDPKWELELYHKPTDKVFFARNKEDGSIHFNRSDVIEVCQQMRTFESFDMNCVDVSNREYFICVDKATRGDWVILGREAT